MPSRGEAERAKNRSKGFAMNGWNFHPSLRAAPKQVSMKTSQTAASTRASTFRKGWGRTCHVDWGETVRWWLQLSISYLRVVPWPMTASISLSRVSGRKNRSAGQKILKRYRCKKTAIIPTWPWLRRKLASIWSPWHPEIIQASEVN